MSQVKELNFDGSTIFCGIDVHKKNWRINIRDSEFELEDFSQNADVVLLHKHLKHKYPGARFRICYEAGFSGFSVQRWLQANGVECLVINAADVPTSDKEKRQKTDKIDARKLCAHLQSKKMTGIYVPDIVNEHARTLVRTRQRLVSNQTRCKNRIWQLLYFSGLPVPDGQDIGKYWSRRFVEQLRQMDCNNSETLKQALLLQLKDYEATRLLVLEATRYIRQLCRKQTYAADLELLCSIPGIGGINAAIILFELQNLRRFKRFDHLCSYVGLVPDVAESGDTKHTKGITARHNRFLRTALVESSWVIIRKDPALLMKYRQYCRRMDKNQAIIRIAKHLLARIFAILKTRVKYVAGVVG